MTRPVLSCMRYTPGLWGRTARAFSILLLITIIKNLILKLLSGKANAKLFAIVILWTYSPMASKLEVALQGNPSPTSSLRTLTLFALLDVVRLGPSRVAPSTLNEKAQRLTMFCSVFSESSIIFHYLILNIKIKSKNY